MASLEPHARVLAHVEQRCRELGVPLTVQRRAIYAAIADRDDHPSADEVFAALQRRVPGISKATTYRTLDKLVEIGLVRRVSHPGAVARFDAKVHRHHHLVCERCGAVCDLESKALDRVALPDVAGHGFELRDFSVLIHGRCRACARKRRPEPPRPSRSRRKA
jgi:Fur family peroxide stress response transcriptional regulator